MKLSQLLKQMLLVCACLFALTGQAIADSQSDAKQQRSITKNHASYPLFFEQIENGVGSGSFIALQFNVIEQSDGTYWAECLISSFYKNFEKTKMFMDMNRVSTEDMTIRNLTVTPELVSFDMKWGIDENRNLRFVATRQGSISRSYQAKAVGLWNTVFDKTKIIKIEWRQIESINLPLPIGN
jgi:hypothetical protein